MEHNKLSLTVIPPLAVTLTFDLLTLKSNQHIYEPTYVCVTKIGWKSLRCFLRYGVHNVLGRTDSLTDWQTRTQNTSGTVFNGYVTLCCCSLNWLHFGSETPDEKRKEKRDGGNNDKKVSK